MQARAVPATLDDVPRLVGLMRDFYAEAGFPLDAGWADRAFRHLLGDPALGRIWLLHAGDGPPGGYVALTQRFSLEHGGLDAFVDDLYVAPAFRRHGLGRAGLEALFAEARRRGIRAVHVEVGEDNDAAQPLYRAFGMRPRDDRRQLLTVQLEEA